MKEKKHEQPPMSDTQVEKIVENLVQDDFAGIPVVDELYKQDAYWTDAIDMEVSPEHGGDVNSPWGINVEEGHFVDLITPLTSAELDSDPLEDDDVGHVTLRYADHFEW